MPQLTPAQLLLELERTDRKIPRRRITSWLQKKLLPPLSKRGRGRGQGKEFFWKEENIFDQSKTVYDLFKLDRQIETALLSLWFMGFTVSSKKFRDMYIIRLRQLVRPIKSKLAKADDLEDALSKASKSHAGSLAKKFLIDRHDFDQGLIEFYGLFVNPNADLKDADYFISDGLTKFIPKLGFTGITPEMCQAIDIEPFLNFYKSTMSHKAVLGLIKSATNDEIQFVQKIWIKVWDFLCPLILCNFPHYNQQGERLSPEQYLAVYFGRGLAPLGLYFLKSHGQEKLENVVAEIIEFSAQYDFSNFYNEIQNFQEMDVLRIFELMSFVEAIIQKIKSP